MKKYCYYVTFTLLGLFFITSCTSTFPKKTTKTNNQLASINDSDIKNHALSIVKQKQFSKHSNIEVIVFNQTVLLLGQVPNQLIQNQVAKQVAEVPGVLKVFNQLIIGHPDTFSDFTQDSWITAKIVSTLIAEGISTIKFKVVTENGIVYMMGHVSKYEGNRASKIASQISGVKKVVNLYSYIDPNIIES